MPLEFYANLLVLGLLFSAIFLFRSIYLKFCLFVFFYPLIVLLCVKFDIPLSGIITVEGKNFFTQQIANSGYLWAIFGYVTFILTLWSQRSKEVKFDRLKINQETRLIFLVCHLIFAAVSYPRAFHLGDGRFNLLPGGGWASIYSLFSMLLVLSSKKKFSVIETGHLLITLFVILGGERADSILILLFMLVYRGDDIKKEVKLSLKLISISSFGVAIALFVGTLRNRALDFLINNTGEMLTLLAAISFATLYNQQTVSDTTHVYLSTIWGYYNDKGNLMTLLNTPFTVFPMTPLGGVPSEYYYQRLMFPYIRNAGGGLFYSEGALNFGMLGVVMYSFILGLVIKRSLQSKKIFGQLILALLFVLQMRIQWYGLLYLMKPLVLLYLFTLVDDLSKKGYFTELKT